MTITPDGKDWTWVLNERCPECGFESWAFPREQIGVLVRTNAAQWCEVLRRSDVRERPNPATWSPLEYACHVRDVYRKYDERLRLMLEAHDPLYPNWDQDVTALEARYDQQDPAVVADELAAAGDAVANAFDGVSDDGWDRPGRRSDGASFTVESIGRYFVHDWIHHIWDVSRDQTAT
ncbi:MAG TPA: DinB family protein [Mycobacteriales bacterium]|nr:DinB family protein [Mycobacteriales bacterium]